MIVDQELLVLPILEQAFEAWLAKSTVRRQQAREQAERQGLAAPVVDAREEHAMLPPWIANPIGLLVLGLDDGSSRPSFCGDIYVKRKLFPKGTPERHYDRGLAREHMLHWTETGRFDAAEDVVEDCEALLRQRRGQRALQHAVVWRSPLLAVFGKCDVVRTFARARISASPDGSPAR